MAKTRTAPNIVSDTALEDIIVYPASFKVRCDHAGVEVREGQEPDIHDEPSAPDAPHLVRHRYETKCQRFGKVEKVELIHADDPARVCPGCGFNRTLVEVA